MASGTTISAVKSAAAASNAKPVQQRSSNPVDSASRRHLPQYKKTMAKLNALNAEIEALKGQLATTPLNTAKYKNIQDRLERLQGQAKLRAEMADFQVSRDGKTVVFTLNDYYTAETFKKTFGIKDGALRTALGREAVAESGEEGNASYSSFEAAKRDGVTRFANGVFIERNWFGVDKVNYSHAIMQAGRQYSVDASFLE